MINNTIHVVARNSYPPLVGMSDVAISLLLTLSQPYRTKPRDCHATICAIGASLRSQRRLRYINKCAADVHRPTDEGRKTRRSPCKLDKKKETNPFRCNRMRMGRLESPKAPSGGRRGSDILFNKKKETNPFLLCQRKSP